MHFTGTGGFAIIRQEVLFVALKDEILTILAGARGGYVSGERLAKEKNVTRAAVWKAVAALRAQGYRIDSTTNRGYALTQSPDILSAEAIEAALRLGGEDARAMCFPELDSTNYEARRRADGLTTPLLIAADRQTKGRGRGAHTFYSPGGTGLYMTLAYPMRLPLSSAALCTQAAAVAVTRAISRAGGPETKIKWVNDLFLGKKKVCGILTEALSDMETGEATCLLIGIGVNLTTADFPGDVAAVAGAVGALPRNELCAGILQALLPLLRALPDVRWMDEYKEKCLTLGRRVTFEKDGAVTEAFAEDLDGAGRLIVRLPDGERLTLPGGEVSVRPEDE